MIRFVPDELIHDILVRLPAAAVLRFRAVCKRWRATVDDPCFAGAHHRRCPPMPLLCLRRDDAADDDPTTTTTTPRHFCIRLDAIDLRAGATQPVIRFTAPARRDHRRKRFPGLLIGSEPWPGPGPGPLIVRDEGDFRVHGSCDGVLLVSYNSGHYLCNPARRRWARVPALTSDGIVGFFAHRPSGEFRVLHLRHRITGGSYDYRIMTLGRRVTFRRIAGGPHSDELLAAIRLRPASEAPPAIVAGNLHWLPPQNHPVAGTSGDLHPILVVFDPVAETFRRMRRPDGQAQALLELDGKLTMTITSLAAAELWVLQDYERHDSWACKLRIPLPPAADIVGVAIVSPEGDVMVQCTNSLLQCDATGRVRMRHQPEHNYRIIAVPHMFRESLVPHGHVDGREITTGYGGIRYPPFFIHCNCHLHTKLVSPNYYQLASV